MRTNLGRGVLFAALVACGGKSEILVVDASAPSDASAEDATADARDATSVTGGDDASVTASNDAGITAADSSDDASDASPFDGPTIHMAGVVVGYPCNPCQGVPNLTVCVYDQPSLPCQTTADGTFDVLVPADSNTALTFIASGYDSALMAVTTGSQDQSGWEIGLSPASAMTALAQALGLTFPATSTGFVTTGIAVYPAGDPNAAYEPVGATIAIKPPASGVGPLYQSPTLGPDPSATSTTASGAAFFGDVTPGTVTVRFNLAGEALNCTPGVGGSISSTPGNEITVPIAAGFDSYANVYCAMSAADSGSDAGAGDSGSDAGTPDSGGGLDAGSDAATADSDAGVDAGSDAAPDAAPDAATCTPWPDGGVAADCVGTTITLPGEFCYGPDGSDPPQPTPTPSQCSACQEDYNCGCIEQFNPYCAPGETGYCSISASGGTLICF